LARILVGFWESPARELAIDETTRAASAQALAFSLRDAVETIASMLMTEEAHARVG